MIMSLLSLSFVDASCRCASKCYHIISCNYVVNVRITNRFRYSLLLVPSAPSVTYEVLESIWLTLSLKRRLLAVQCILLLKIINVGSIQCFDTVGWVTGRASGL